MEAILQITDSSGILANPWFDWGGRVQKLSDQVLKLLEGGETLRQARLKALKLTTEIQQGFGSSENSPSSLSPPFSEASPGSSSFCSFSTTSSTTPTPTFMDSNEYLNKHGLNKDSNIVFRSKNVDKNHIWDGPASTAQEGDILVDSDDDDDEKLDKPKGFVSEIYSKIVGNNGGDDIRGSHEKIGYFRCISSVGNGTKGTNKKKFDRQNSLWF
ncbi:hypothetical protein Lal_00022333 [Lupinus albus]|nr:hypothetical protein Lal_00022333 [Lupinus albus]